MNKIAMFGKIALLTAVMLGVASSAASAVDSIWKGSAHGSTTIYQDQVVGDLDQEYTNHDIFIGWGGGQLGSFTAEGGHTIAWDLTISGQATWVSADGASLFVTYVGNVIITEDRDFPYLFTAVLTADGGTGRLCNATGSAEMSGGFSGTLEHFYFDFEGTLDTKGNFHEFGMIELESLACGLGQTVPYTMEGWNKVTGMNGQTGSIMPTSDPEIDQTIPGMTICRFLAEQGPNADYFDLPVHVITTPDGLIFCRWEAQCTIEIDHDNYGAARLWFDGLFIVEGGTGVYQDAWGSWQTVFATEPCYGDDPGWCVYMTDGMLRLDQIVSDSTANVLIKTKKTK